MGNKKQYEYIDYSKIGFPSYSLNSKVRDIKTKDQWSKAAEEISDILDSGEVLDRCGRLIGRNVFKKDEIYVFSDGDFPSDPSYVEKIKNREKFDIVIADDPSDENWVVKDKINAIFVYDNLEDALSNIRIAYHLGYETRFIDLGNNRKHIAVVDGYHIG